MIFVTVGSCVFDRLVSKVDELCGAGVIRDRVVCQIGSGSCLPQHAEHFRYEATLSGWYEQADVIVCHGGTGTVRELLALGKPFVAVANESLSGDHQADFLAACERAFGILWCRDLDNLPAAIEAAPACRPRVKEGLHLADDLRSYLQGRGQAP